MLLHLDVLNCIVASSVHIYFEAVSNLWDVHQFVLHLFHRAVFNESVREQHCSASLLFIVACSHVKLHCQLHDSAVWGGCQHVAGDHVCCSHTESTAMASHLGVSSDAVGARSCRKLSSRSSHRSTTSPCSPVNIQMDPPQIATEVFSSDSLSERSPEQHTKNLEKI